MNPNRAFLPAGAQQGLRQICHPASGRDATVLRALAMILSFMWATTLVRGQHVAGTVRVGDQPSAVAVNLATNKIYVSNAADGTVTVIDGASGATVPVVVGDGPGAIGINPVTNRIYVAHPASGTVTVIDGATNLTTTLVGGPNPTSTAISSMVVNPVTNKVYIANFGSAGGVGVIDGATNIVTPVTLADGPNLYRLLAMDPVANRIYVTKDGDGTFDQTGFGAVGVIDGATDAMIATWYVGSRHSQYESITVNPVTNKVFVSDFGYGSVAVVDGMTGSAVAQVPLGFAFGPSAMVVNPVTNRIYIADLERIAVVDGASYAVTATLPKEHNAWPMAVDTIRNRIYLTDREGGSVTVIDGVTNGATTLATGGHPGPMAVNPVTNKAYVVNPDGATLWVIDGARYHLEKVMAGMNPGTSAVDPVTHKVYVANYMGGTVTVIDPGTHATASVTVGSTPGGVSIDPVANRIYVANTFDDTLTVIDGATNGTTTVPVCPYPWIVIPNPATGNAYVLGDGSCLMAIEGATYRTVMLPVGRNPSGLAVNPATNKIYLADYLDGNVRVFDGATNALVATVEVGTALHELRVDPVANKIYVGSSLRPVLTVIDGGTNATTEIAVGGGAPAVIDTYALALDPVRNKVYLASHGASLSDAVLTVVDGATLAATTLPLDRIPKAIGVNPVTGQVFVIYYGDGTTLTVLDGATLGRFEIPIGAYPGTLSVDPGTNRIYVTNYEDGTVTVVDVDEDQPVPMTLVATGTVDAFTIPNDRLFTTTNPNPSFAVVTTSTFVESAAYLGLGGAVNPPITSLYYRVDDGPSAAWSLATRITPVGVNPSTFGLSLSDQWLGVHSLHLFAAYGEEGGGAFMPWSGTGPVPVISRLQAVPFAVLPIQTATTLTADANPQNAGRPVTFTATVRPDHAGPSAPSGVVAFRDGAVLLGEGTLVTFGEAWVATFQARALAEGTHTITATYPGDAHHAGSTGSLVERIAGMPAAIRVFSGNDQAAKVKHPFEAPLVALVLDSRDIPVPNATVTFLGAGLAFSPGSTVISDASGQARVWATPLRGGHLMVTASVAGASTPAVFTETGGGKKRSP